MKTIEEILIELKERKRYYCLELNKGSLSRDSRIIQLSSLDEVESIIEFIEGKNES